MGTNGCGRTLCRTILVWARPSHTAQGIANLGKSLHERVFHKAILVVLRRRWEVVDHDWSTQSDSDYEYQRDFEGNFLHVISKDLIGNWKGQIRPVWRGNGRPLATIMARGSAEHKHRP
ncbi:hypothetical protein T440DRAFT_479456 [Plenodomus tracheiphilus IPT5]|uniref:Uncharacterized protein n=1 Tax=Plenodomus tracheiphilus IPT5 TaxID=1408161 RepID=A0A6A7B539_9PLEO|nr:hypothetical protein T440DRAFT_479456 [Plenodomus tracheiphilus IPT5]